MAPPRSSLGAPGTRRFDADAVSARPTSAVVRADQLSEAPRTSPHETGAEAVNLHLRRSTRLSARHEGRGSNHLDRRLLGARRTRGYGVSVKSRSTEAAMRLLK